MDWTQLCGQKTEEWKSNSTNAEFVDQMTNRFVKSDDSFFFFLLSSGL